MEQCNGWSTHFHLLIKKYQISNQSVIIGKKSFEESFIADCTRICHFGNADSDETFIKMTFPFQCVPRECSWSVWDLIWISSGWEVRDSHCVADASDPTHLPLEKWPRFRSRYFRRIFVNWKCCILIKISLKFVTLCAIEKAPTRV